MAEENEDGQEKTEEPSQRKIEKAKEDGKVLSSKENSFTLLVNLLKSISTGSSFDKSTVCSSPS